MCYTCYEKYGKPAIVNEKVLVALLWINRVYDEVSCSGGNLHIQIDDWNLDDEHFLDVLPNFHKNSPERFAIEKQCYQILKHMTVNERASALAIYDGFVIGPDKTFTPQKDEIDSAHMGEWPRVLFYDGVAGTSPSITFPSLYPKLDKLIDE